MKHNWFIHLEGIKHPIGITGKELVQINIDLIIVDGVSIEFPYDILKIVEG